MERVIQDDESHEAIMATVLFGMTLKFFLAPVEALGVQLALSEQL